MANMKPGCGEFVNKVEEKKVVNWTTAVESDPMVPFSLDTGISVGEGTIPSTNITQSCWYSFYQPWKDGKLNELCFC